MAARRLPRTTGQASGGTNSIASTHIARVELVIEVELPQPEPSEHDVRILGSGLSQHPG